MTESEKNLVRKMERDSDVSLGNIDVIPDARYCLFGTGKCTRILIELLKNIRRKLPEVVLEMNPTMSKLCGIEVRDIADFEQYSSLPIVLGSCVYQLDMWNKIAATCRYPEHLHIIDLGSGGRVWAEKYQTALFARLNNAFASYHIDNYDELRFGSPAPTTKLSAAYYRRLGETVLSELPNSLTLEWLYNKLGDALSKVWVVDIAAYRLVGYRHVKLLTNNLHKTHSLNSIMDCRTQKAPLQTGFMHFVLDHFDLNSIGFPLEVYATLGGIQKIFATNNYAQYAFSDFGKAIHAKPGDTVIDAGSCWGETSVYFAEQVGEQGKVFAVEFAPMNLSIFKKNIQLNPQLASRIKLINKALWSESGMSLAVTENGPGTFVKLSNKSGKSNGVTTISIDDLAEREKMKKVDFIKMDIEGAELEALKGAEKTIRRDRPNLAISVYHNGGKDMETIPRWLDALNEGYTLYIRHYAIYSEETVLFATCHS